MSNDVLIFTVDFGMILKSNAYKKLCTLKQWPLYGGVYIKAGRWSQGPNKNPEIDKFFNFRILTPNLVSKV